MPACGRLVNPQGQLLEKGDRPGVLSLGVLGHHHVEDVLHSLGVGVFFSPLFQDLGGGLWDCDGVLFEEGSEAFHGGGAEVLGDACESLFGGGGFAGGGF